jgi:hypothetical protein
MESIDVEANVYLTLNKVVSSNSAVNGSPIVRMFYSDQRLAKLTPAECDSEESEVLTCRSMIRRSREIQFSDLSAED